MERKGVGYRDTEADRKRSPSVTMAGVEPSCSLDPFIAHIQVVADRPTRMQMDDIPR